MQPVNNVLTNDHNITIILNIILIMIAIKNNILVIVPISHTLHTESKLVRIYLVVYNHSQPPIPPVIVIVAVAAD